MKVLFIHSRYLVAGGEEVVLKLESELLKCEHEVEVLEFVNKYGFPGFFQFLISIWNPFAGYKLRKTIKRFKPDIIHIHNWHFACGPIVIRQAKYLNVPIVMTLHNFRLLCPSATLLKNGEIFTQSLKVEFPWYAIRKKVYRNSYFQTFWLSFIVWFHNKIGTWEMVEKYIVPSPHIIELFKQSVFKFPLERFIVKPNFVFPGNYSGVSRGKYFLYVGRLSVEKGLNVLLEAFGKINSELVIVGAGPLQAEVELAATKNSNIHFKGELQRADVFKLLQECTALIFPSIWYETFGLVIIEAFSVKTPVIASKIGASATLVESGYNGLHIRPGSAANLIEKLEEWIMLTEEEKRIKGENAEHTFKANFSPEQNAKLLTGIYLSVCNN